MKYILETDKLGLSAFTTGGIAFIIELLNTPGWLQFIRARNVKTEEQAKQYNEDDSLKSSIKNGYGIWLVERKKDNKAISMCGIINRDFF